MRSDHHVRFDHERFGVLDAQVYAGFNSLFDGAVGQVPKIAAPPRFAYCLNPSAQWIPIVMEGNLPTEDQ